MRRSVIISDVSPMEGAIKVGFFNIFMLVLLAVILFYPLLFSRITTFDDAQTAINYGSNAGLLDVAKHAAVKQGRFTFLWGYPLLRVPYILDSQFWYVFVKYGSFFILMNSLYFAVSRLFRSSWIALLSLVLFLALIQNGWDHNALTSYPFAFNFLATLFLMSLGLLSVALDRQSIALASFSAILYFFALGNELFVLFFPFFIAVLLSRSNPGESIWKTFISHKKYIVPVSLALLMYLIIYSIWRYEFPSQYDGNSLNGLNIVAAVKVISAYSFSAFPLASVNFMISHDPHVNLTESVNLWGFLSELNVSNFIKPVVAGVFVARLLTAKNFIVPGQRTMIIGASLACIGIFVPNILLGFVLRHQNWVASGSYSYLYTYYSFIAAVVFISLVLAILNSLSRAWEPWLRQSFVCFSVIFVVILGFSVEVRNQYIANDQKLSHRKWQLIDEVIKSPHFMEIPDGATMVAPTLSAHRRGIAVAPAEYWTKYIKYKVNKNVNFVDDECISDVPCYSLVFRQELHADRQFVVLAKINNFKMLTSRSLMIYSLSNQNPKVLMGSFLANDYRPTLEVNNVVTNNFNKEFFATKYPDVSVSGQMKNVSLSGNVDVFPDQVSVSYIDVIPRLFPIGIELGSGFYNWESDLVQPNWVWSNGVSTLKVVNYSNKAMNVDINFEATSLEFIALNVSGLGANYFKISPGEYTPVKINFLAKPGVNYLDLHSDKKPISPGNGDSRDLSFSIRSLNYR